MPSFFVPEFSILSDHRSSKVFFILWETCPAIASVVSSDTSGFSSSFVIAVTQFVLLRFQKLDL
jgi:hypothetical protein